jgi:hypothetical protein
MSFTKSIWKTLFGLCKKIVAYCILHCIKKLTYFSRIILLIEKRKYFQGLSKLYKWHVFIFLLFWVFCLILQVNLKKLDLIFNFINYLQSVFILKIFFSLSMIWSNVLLYHVVFVTCLKINNFYLSSFYLFLITSIM